MMSARQLVVVASRLENSSFPLDSLPGIKEVAGVVDVVELRVRETLDGHLIIMRDATVERATDGYGRVGEMTWAEIEKLQLKGDAGKTTGLKVPSAEETIDALPRDKLLLIERESGSPVRFLDLIRGHGLARRAVLSSKDWRFLGDVRQAAPEIRLAVRSDDKWTPGRRQVAHRIGIKTLISPFYVVRDPPLISSMHEAGFDLWVTGTNDISVLSNLVKMNIDGVETSRPSYLMQIKQYLGASRLSR